MKQSKPKVSKPNSPREDEEAKSAELALAAANAISGASYDTGNISGLGAASEGTSLASAYQDEEQGATNRARLEEANLRHAGRFSETTSPSQLVVE